MVDLIIPNLIKIVCSFQQDLRPLPKKDDGEEMD